MSKSLFNTAEPKTIGGQPVVVNKVPFEAFDSALIFGAWMQGQNQGAVPNLAALVSLRAGTAERDALEYLLAACIAVDQDGETRQLTVADVRAMPITTVLEAVYVVLELNLDFFTRSLAAIKPIQARLMSIGSPLLSSSSQQATTDSKSGATA